MPMRYGTHKSAWDDMLRGRPFEWFPRLEARTTVRRARPELPGEQNLEFTTRTPRKHGASIPPGHSSTSNGPRHGDRASDKRAGLSNAALRAFAS